MKLEIPIIVGFDDMESLLDDLKKLQTYKCFEGAEEVLVDIEDVAKVLMDHVKAQKSVKGDDLISRADALNCFHDWIDSHGDVHTADEMPEYQRIEQLPSAQPETYKEKLKEIADALSEKFAYMNTCLNERDIILGYLGVKRPSKIHCNTDCTNIKCESHRCNKRLPTAQPEIIRCKDCKFARMTYDGECKYCDIWFPDEKTYMDGDYFCASAERRTDE